MLLWHLLMCHEAVFIKVRQDYVVHFTVWEVKLFVSVIDGFRIYMDA